VDDLLTMQADNVVTWAAGTLSMGGELKLRIKTDKKDPSLKEIKIEKAGKNDGTTTLVSSSGGVNPNLANGGWHEVKIKNMANVTVDFDFDSVSYAVTGFLKELKVKLDRNSTTGNPIVRDFKLKIKAATSIPDIKKGIVYGVTVDVPETVVKAQAGTEYEEKVKDKPEFLSGHTAAEYEREDGAVPEGVDITTLDGNNDLLKERVGSCDVSPEQATCPCWTEGELQATADIAVLTCQVDIPGGTSFVFGLGEFGDDEFAQTVGGVSPVCRILEDEDIGGQADVFREISITPEELATCEASIAAECERRGF